MVSADGYNVFLIVVTVVAAVMIAATTLYLLVAFSHPEDRNQAWVPKIVVCLSMFVAILTVLSFPLDVANRRACNSQILFSDCDLTLPMKGIWYGLYIANVVLVYLVTPFTVFYYEADSDHTLMRRLRSALIWTALAVIVFGVILGILYAVGGDVEYDTVLLTSGVAALGDVRGTGDGAVPALADCIPLPGNTAGTDTCAAVSGPTEPPTEVWSQQPTFFVFVVAVASILGWLLLMVMGGVGLVALPLDMILAFFARPQKTITKTQYIQQARAIGERAKEMAVLASELKRQQDSNGRGRKTRAQARALNKQLMALEDEERELAMMYPQGEDRDTKWVLYVLGFWASLVVGILFALIAISWIVHIVVYIIISPPLSPFLNSMFRELDDVFVLCGVAVFALWCFFLILAAIKGLTKLGLNFLFIQLYPMKLGATMMNSFLVNAALILLASTAVVQFCTVAFADYAQGTAIQEIFGNNIYNLKGVRHIFINNVFIYIMLGFAVLTVLWLAIRGPRSRQRAPKTLEEIYAMG